MNVGIYTNIFKDKQLLITKKLIELFQKNAIDYFVYENIIENLSNDRCFCDNNINSLDILITIGGDGTILNIAKKCAFNNVPILGINLGNVGFLTEIEVIQLDNIIDILKNKNYYIEKRSMLEIEISNKKYFALNEIVVSRSNDSKMISLDININNQLVDRYFCDGFIVCTPTGSTAYSLSAGGPILSPNTHAMALTPINSHSLHSRPIVVSDSETVSIMKNLGTQNALIILDGENTATVENNQQIIISKCAREVFFIRLHNSNFYYKLLSKLNTWGVTVNEER